MNGRSTYVGPADLHDGRILEVDSQENDQQDFHVVAEGASGQRYVIAFRDVRSVTAHRPVGMLLYGLAAWPSPGEGQRFEFVNWEEEDDARLEVTAGRVEVAEGERP